MPRNPRHPKDVLLLQLLDPLDAGVSPQAPVDPAAWIALLAAPLVAQECARLCARHEVRRAGARRAGAVGLGGSLLFMWIS